MKKIFLTAMVLAVVTMFTACTKEGVYNPSKKISRIYESDGSAKVLDQLWHWDGNKLSSIDHYSSSGSINYTYNFSYDGNRMSRVDCYAANYYVEFTYDGSKLKKFNAYSGGALSMSADVTYKSGKVSQMTITYNDKSVATKSPEMMQMEANLLDLFVPCFDKEQHIKALASKSVYTTTNTFTWKGDNITESVQTEGSYRGTRSYTYDKKRNPYYRDLFASYDESFVAWGSKNNVLSQIYTSQDNDGSYTRNYNYSYTYDGNYPTIQNISYTYSYDGTSYSNSYTTYYEYE